jgi:hypothetical protein
MRFFTYKLTSSTPPIIQISQTDGVMFLSVQSGASTGSCTVLGNLPFKGLAPQTVDISASQGINLSAISPASPLDGITITWGSGVVDVLIGF